MVDAVSRFLDAAGFNPLRGATAAQVAAHGGQGLGVISLAVMSDAAVSVAQAYRTWTQHGSPRALLFTGLAGKDSAQLGLTAELGSSAPRLVRPTPGAILEPGEAPYVLAPDLSGEAAVTLTDWLTQAVRRPKAERVIASG